VWEEEAAYARAVRFDRRIDAATARTTSSGNRARCGVHDIAFEFQNKRRRQRRWLRGVQTRSERHKRTLRHGGTHVDGAAEICAERGTNARQVRREAVACETRRINQLCIAHPRAMCGVTRLFAGARASCEVRRAAYARAVCRALRRAEVGQRVLDVDQARRARQMQHHLAHWLAVAVRVRVRIDCVDVRSTVGRLRDVELSGDNNGVLSLVRHIVVVRARVAKLIVELHLGTWRRIQQRQIVDVRRRAEGEHHVAAIGVGTRLRRWLALVVGEDQALAKRHAIGTRSAGPTTVTPALTVAIGTRLVGRAEHELRARHVLRVEHRHWLLVIVVGRRRKRNAVLCQRSIERVARRVRDERVEVQIDQRRRAIDARGVGDQRRVAQRVAVGCEVATAAGQRGRGCRSGTAGDCRVNTAAVDRRCRDLTLIDRARITVVARRHVDTAADALTSAAGARHSARIAHRVDARRTLGNAGTRRNRRRARCAIVREELRARELRCRRRVVTHARSV